MKSFINSVILTLTSEYDLLDLAFLKDIFNRRLSLFMALSFVLLHGSSGCTQSNPTPERMAQVTLAYGESKQVSINNETITLTCNEIKIKFREGVLSPQNQESYSILADVNLSIGGTPVTLLGRGLTDGQGNRQPANWTQLRNAPNRIVRVSNLSIGVSDVYRDSNKPANQANNLVADILIAY